jgi:hypothetical protein
MKAEKPARLAADIRTAERTEPHLNSTSHSAQEGGT